MGVAVRCYNRALELNPRDNETWYKKGNALEKLGWHHEAARCCDKAIKVDADRRQ
jgi:Flp pilus assembly protein TadD